MDINANTYEDLIAEPISGDFGTAANDGNGDINFAKNAIAGAVAGAAINKAKLAGLGISTPASGATGYAAKAAFSTAAIARQNGLKDIYDQIMRAVATKTPGRQGGNLNKPQLGQPS